MFHLLYLSCYDEVTFCKITSLFKDHIVKFCLSSYDYNFKRVLDFIEKNKLSLKQINLIHCDIDDRDLEPLSVMNELNLTSIILRDCDRFTNLSFSKLFKSQNNIVELNICSCTISDDAVFSIAKYLPKIKSLIMEGCSRITDVSLFL